MIEIDFAHFGFDLAARIGQFGLALRQYRLRLGDVGTGLAALPDRNVQRTVTLKAP